jgi:hypothetical protein
MKETEEIRRFTQARELEIGGYREELKPFKVQLLKYSSPRLKEFMVEKEVIILAQNRKEAFNLAQKYFDIPYQDETTQHPYIIDVKTPSINLREAIREAEEKKLDILMKKVV